MKSSVGKQQTCSGGFQASEHDFTLLDSTRGLASYAIQASLPRPSVRDGSDLLSADSPLHVQLVGTGFLCGDIMRHRSDNLSALRRLALLLHLRIPFTTTNAYEQTRQWHCNPSMHTNKADRRDDTKEREATMQQEKEMRPWQHSPRAALFQRNGADTLRPKKSIDSKRSAHSVRWATRLRRTAKVGKLLELAQRERIYDLVLEPPIYAYPRHQPAP